MKQPAKFGIARKLSVAFAAVALVPLCAALLVMLFVFLAQARFVESELLWGKIELASLSYGSEREKLGRALEGAASSNAILLNLEIGLDFALSGLLSDLASGQGLNGAWIFDSAGRCVAAAGGPRPERLDPGAFAALAAPRPSEGAAFALLAAGRLPIPAEAALVAARPLRNGRGSLIGSVVAAIGLRRLAEAASEASGGPVFFALDEGPWICSSTLAAAEVSPPRLDYSEAGRRDPRSLNASGSVGSDTYLFRLRSLPEPGALLGVAYPEAELARPRIGALLGVGLAGAAALLLAALGAAYFSALIARPLASLAVVAREIAEGVYGIKVEASSGDEIGELARDFNAMSERLLTQDLERLRAEEALRESELQFRSIFDGVTDAIFVHDVETGAIVDTNKAMRRMYGLPEDEAFSGGIQDVSEGTSPYDADHSLDLLERARSGENPVTEWRARRRDGSLFWVEVALRRASLGGVDRILVVCRDITARKEAECRIEESLREKETLLREIHHRVKNNFQIINSLFDLQLLGVPDSKVAEALREPRSRIHAMALIHERLYQSPDFESVDFAEYMRELANELFLGYGAEDGRIELAIEAESVALDMDRAIPCGLVLNELMTNALKYAFPDPRRGGTILVRLAREGGEVSMTVEDDGVGMDTGAVEEPGGSLGLTLSRILAQQLRGTFSIESSGGVKATLRFPAEAESRRD
jgi:PAS domain S-box-containing protein